METLLDAIKWAWDNATPKITLVFVMILAALQFVQFKKHSKTEKLLDHHLDPENRHPHPECEWSEKSYYALVGQLDKLHQENREDHKEILELILRHKSNPE